MSTDGVPARPHDSDQSKHAVNMADDWFRRFPNGGTVFVDPAAPPQIQPVSHRFREMPNGGGTVFTGPKSVEPPVVGVDFFARDMPTGGGTVYHAPDGGDEGDE